MKTELNNKYLTNIKNIKNKQLKKEKNIYFGKYCCTDEEELHKQLDNELINLLKELGYLEVVNEYTEAKDYFWYSQENK